MKCYECEVELNPIQEPRVYDDDLDARDVQGEEYCYNCYENLECTYCEICGEDFPYESYCDHLFWGQNGATGAGAYMDKWEKAHICSQVKTAWYYILKAQKERDYPLESIKKFQSDVVSLLSRNALRFGTYGSCFGDEALRIISAEGVRPYMSDLVFYTDEMWDKKDKLADGGSWLMTLDEQTVEANKETLKWIKTAAKRFFNQIKKSKQLDGATLK